MKNKPALEQWEHFQLFKKPMGPAYLKNHGGQQVLAVFFLLLLLLLLFGV